MSQVTRETNRQTSSPLLTRAKRFGYKGEDKAEAAKYLNDFFKEVKLLLFFKEAKLLLSPDRFYTHKHQIVDESESNTKQVNLEKTLNNLNIEDIVILYGFDEIYSKSFEKLRNYFHSTSNLNHSPEDIPNIQKRKDFALSQAFDNNDPDAMEFLLKNGANPNIKNRKGKSLIHLAAKSGRLNSIELLVKYGANINALDNKNKTALTAAFKRNRKANPALLKFLLEHGANPNIRNSFGSTALHLAAYASDLETVKLLLKHGADPNLKDFRGKKPYQVATTPEIREAIIMALF